MKTSIPEIINPLKHSGTNRFERLGAALEDSYVQIEERHESVFLAQAEQLAASFQYYDNNNMPAGDWSSFFNRQTPENEPHRALFIAFLRLIEALNEHANGLTKRHLNYYYQEVLEFGKRKVKPAHVHLFFTCAETLKERFLAKHAELSAGDTADGQKIMYQLVNELVVNRSKLISYLALHQHPTAFRNQLFSKDYTSLLTIDAEENSTGIPTFGEQQLVYKKKDGHYHAEAASDGEKTMDHAQVGFALSTPILRLEEGERTLHLRLSLGGSYPKKLTEFSKYFKVELTTEEGWFHLKEKEDQKTNISCARGAQYNELELRLTLQPTHPAIVNYDASVHEGAYKSKNPLVRMLLLHEPEDSTQTDWKFGYADWKTTEIHEVTLSADVKGVQSVIVQNELSTLDASKPFRPFGPIPSIGNQFYIGHPELFKNQLEKLRVDIKWKDLPAESFEKHYEGYEENIKNDSFKISGAILQDRNWIQGGDWKNPAGQNLFPANLSSGNTSLLFNAAFWENYQRKTNDSPISEWNYKTHYGFLKLQLIAPITSKFQAFGHAVYAKEMLRNNALPEANATGNPAPPYKTHIEQGYSPMIERLLVDYTTKAVAFSHNDADQFYHVGAFGQKTCTLNEALAPSTLLPHYPYEGEFYIGLQEVQTPQTVSLLFQLVEGSGDASLSQIKTNIEWHYLSTDEWKPINRLRISKDTTDNLLKTGIMHFDLPKDCNAQHHIMPTNTYWIKASIPEKSGGIDFLRGIHVQAVEAAESQPEISSEVVKPNSIAKLTEGGKGITAIAQPYASFGGTNQENESEYYARVSERLRHKDRSINIWDYERMVLDAFPEIYKVKCLNHTNYQTELVAGHVMLAVIPNLRNKEEKSPFQPKLSMHRRMDIYDFLRQKISPFIYLRVENPIYEPLKLSFNVGFHQGYDEGFYGKKLHQQLQEFLSPWAFENGLQASSELVFGGELHKSTVLKFIEDLPYVDFVNDFNLYHRYEDARIRESFKTELDSPGENYTTYTIDDACSVVKMAFQADNDQVPTTFIAIKLRFLYGITKHSKEDLNKKFMAELLTMLHKRARKGKAITRTLVRSLVKSIYYVDQIVHIKLYKDLPNNQVLDDVDVAVAKTSRSIMVTSEQHRIGVYKAGDFKCEGNLMIGIGFMIVEADFILPEIKKENYEYETR